MRQIYNEAVKEILKELSTFIKEYTDFGLEIWLERLNNSINETVDLPANLLFRQILEMSDAISELIRQGCINASKPLLRSSLDCYLQLMYLLVDGEKEKASLFLYHYNLKKYKTLERMINPEKEISYNNKLKKDKNFKGFNLTEEEKRFANRDFLILTSVLNSEANRNTAKLYGDKLKKNWYGLANIEQLCIQLEEPAFYEFLYRDLSEFLHGIDIVHNNLKLISESYWGIKALRDIADTKNLFDSTILILERAILLFLKEKIINKEKFKNESFKFLMMAKNFRSREIKFD